MSGPLATGGSPRASRPARSRLAPSCRARAAQRGLSLVELMIAMLLGLVVVAAVFNMYTGTRRSSLFTEGLQTMQENGRFGVSVLQKGLRLAGYSPASPLDAFDIDESGGDRITVRLRQAFDCTGEPTDAFDGIAVNTYAHDAANSRITCAGNATLPGNAMPIVEDVDGFRILYGLDENADDVPDRYRSYDAALDPARIAALRFALLVSSGEPIRTRATEERYVLLDEVVGFDDRVARSVFASTVKLRNRR